MLLPLLMQLGMLGRDRHDGDFVREERRPDEDASKLEASIARRSTIEAAFDNHASGRIVKSSFIIDASTRDAEIETLMHRMIDQDEDESIALLLLH